MWWCALALYCGLIFYLSGRSTLPSLANAFEGQDKIIHATAYAVMAGLFWQAGQFRWSKQPYILASMVIAWCAFYGITDEWHQSFVIGRDASVFDWLADVTGAVLFCLFRLRYSHD